MNPFEAESPKSVPSGHDGTLGLRPRDAALWLRLQRAHALRPEKVAAALRQGLGPGQILASMRPDRGGVRRPRANPGRYSEGRERDDSRRLEALGIRLLPLTDPGFPPALAELEDPPGVLQVRGCASRLDMRSIAIVGARAATHSARAMARRLARQLASAGFTIVSGLARGIDAEAHRGALEAGGRTIAVLAGGLDNVYPPEHRGLADALQVSGALLSEMPLGVSPRRELFPLRNRIISGLCEAVVVVEARRRSGSLITVRHALAQGRDVFVVPGSVDGPFAQGTLQLLRDGARPIRHAADLIEDLGGIGVRTEVAPSGYGSVRGVAPLAPFGETAARILECLAGGPATREELVVAVELDPARLSASLLDLELAERIVEERDGRFHLVGSPALR